VDARLADFAAEIGPHLDRLRLGVMREPVEAGAKLGMFAGSGLDPDTRLVETRLVHIAPTKSMSLSGRGRVLISQVRGLNAPAVTDLLGSGTLPVLPLADRCLLAAAATRLAERLTGLRWHRFDAYVAAWTSAGLSARSVTDLEPRSGTRQDRSRHQRTSGPGIRRADS